MERSNSFYPNYLFILWINEIFVKKVSLHISHTKVNVFMKFTIDKQDRYTVFSLKEENLNTILAPSLKSEFVIMINEGVQNLILDLSAVTFVDSSGLSAILTANRLWSEERSFILTGIKHDSVKKLITISRLDSVLTIIPTVQESVDYVIMEEIERELNSDEDKS